MKTIADLLAEHGCDMAFTGTLAQFFPDSGGSLEAVERVDPGPAAAGLEGTFRPGHFDGVATIVHRLFEIVRPTRAYFGQKDFQQSLVVTDVARRLGAPEIVVCPTSREASGAARMKERKARRERPRTAPMPGPAQPRAPFGLSAPGRGGRGGRLDRARGVRGSRLRRR